MEKTITRKRFEELLSELKKEYFPSFYHLDDSELWEKYDIDFKIVARERKIDKHRWYELTESIIQVGEWFVGVYGATQMYSESMSWSDLEIDCDIYEVERVEKVVYDYLPL